MAYDVTCPLCSGRMTSRTNKSTGQRFWGCNNYPRCKGTRNTDGEVRNNFARSYDNSHGEPEEDLPSDRQRSNDKRRWS